MESYLSTWFKIFTFQIFTIFFFCVFVSKIFKTLLLLQFSSDWTKLYCKYVGHEGMNDFFDNLTKIKKFITLWRTIWGWKFQNAPPRTVLIRSEPKFMINKVVTRECKIVNVLAICQNLKFCDTWNFNLWVNGKILKCAISCAIAADRRAKTDENVGLGVLQETYLGYFWCPIPWDWFRVIRCTLQNFQFFKFLCYFPKFHPFSTKRYCKYVGREGI